MCILFGCDYCHNLIDIKPNEIYSVYIKYKSIEKTLEELKTLGYIIPEKFEYTEAKEYFKSSLSNPIIQNDIKMKEPDNDKLLNLLVNNYGLIKNNIIIKLNRLNILYNKFKDF